MKRELTSDSGPWAAAVTIGIWAFGLWMLYHGPAGLPPIPPDGVLWAAPFVGSAAIGGLITAQKPTNRIGWLLIAAGLLQGLGLFASTLFRYLYAAGASPAAVAWLTVAAGSLSPLSYGALALIPLTFPSGRLLSPRWRWLAAAVVAFALLGVADNAVSPDRPLPGGLPISPLANRALAHLLDLATSFPLEGLVFLTAASSLPFRYVRGDAVVRQQMKWFGLGIGLLVVCLVLRGLGDAGVPSTSWSPVVGTAIVTLGLLGPPAAIGIAILRHRLFDVDLLITRALVYGTLGAVVTTVYLGFVVAAAELVGHAGGSTNLVITVVATIALAAAFQPLRQWLTGVVNRLVYGRRYSPYDSLTMLARQLEGSYALDGVLPVMVEAVGRGLRCRAAAVSIDGGRTLYWPVDSAAPEAAPDLEVAISHGGERYGALAIWAHPGEQLAAAEKGMLSDLALQAGLVLHNARLRGELEERLEELRASRRRVVTAQDAERRRLERDLHDGAQHDLIALLMRLSQAEGKARTTGSELVTELGALRADAAATLETVQRLARGLYSPLLESQGVAAALAAQSRRLPIPVDIEACAGRFAPEVETAVYFCCMEALQNVAKHSQAKRAWIRISTDDHGLHFEVDDDGRGFDPSTVNGGSGVQNMRDRVDAIEGTVRIRSGPRGTRVEGLIPV
ncbi:MAG TPA: sensor histidine kinase [Candidatus Dormibacteraeota bacterium]